MFLLLPWFYLGVGILHSDQDLICAQGSFLEGLREPYVVPGIESGSKCIQGKYPPAVLSLGSQGLDPAKMSSSCPPTPSFVVGGLEGWTSPSSRDWGRFQSHAVNRMSVLKRGHILILHMGAYGSQFIDTEFSTWVRTSLVLLSVELRMPQRVLWAGSWPLSGVLKEEILMDKRPSAPEAQGHRAPGKPSRSQQQHPPPPVLPPLCLPWLLLARVCTRQGSRGPINS